jgi:DNA-binding NarL/FixJ family response regulator
MERNKSDIPVTYLGGGKITVFLSDQQVLFREGIHFILSGEEEFDVIGEASGNQEALTLIEANPPHVAVLNFSDSNISGPELTRHIRRNSPHTFVILTYDRREEEGLFAAVKAGAGACVTKDIDPEQLLDVIKSVARGDNPITEELLLPQVASLTLAEFTEMAEIAGQFDVQLASITAREKELLDGIASGSGIENLAAELSEDMIRNSLKLILGKLVANDRDLALLEVVQRNLPAIMGGIGKKRGEPSDYLTRAEFDNFKKSLTKRLKGLAS